MTYVGIDLAADPKRTGVAVLRTDADSCTVQHVAVGADDDDLIGAIRSSTKTGLDVPLGWPQRFVELLAAHAAGPVPAPASTGPEWRRGLAMRATDLAVHRQTGLTPLSVSTDRIAHPALRWAGLEARLREFEVDVCRDGSGVVCEVYPAAALRCWSLRHRGYKGPKNAGQRSELVAELSRALPWLDWNGFRELCAAEDDALDAVLAALIAREAHLGQCAPPPAELRETSRREGWIWLPRHELPTSPGRRDVPAPRSDL